MPRPKLPRRLQFEPNVYYFKPRGIPLSSLTEVVITKDEIEALKLCDYESSDQTICARSMQISQPTFARIIASARRKVATAIINSQAIRIEKSI